MKVTVNKVDEANVIVSGTIANDVVEAYINTMAAQAGKEMKVDGFRKGKVPAHVVKKLHGDKLEQDAEGEALKELIDLGIKEAGINAADMLGQPTFKKYDKKDDGIEVEVEVSVKPVFDLEGYMDVLPSFEKPTADQKEIDEKLNEIASGNAPYTKIKRKRMVRDGDMTLIDFEGFVDGTAFDGGKAEKFNLKIGSAQFIPGFEEQIIGMKYEEQKDVVWVQTWDHLKGVHNKTGVKVDMPIHRLYVVNTDNKIETIINYNDRTVWDELGESFVARENGTIYNHHDNINLHLNTSILYSLITHKDFMLSSDL